MRWTLPSWIAIALGTLFTIFGLMFMLFVKDPKTASDFVTARLINAAPIMILAGGILLAAGLLSLQSAWCTWCSDGGAGCSCCGDDCKCGDCGDCCGPGEGHEGHSH